MTDITIGPYVRGEKPPPLEYSFLDSAGAAIDLTGYTALLRVQRTDASDYLDLTATVTAPTAGTVQHVWTGAEFATAGDYWLEFWTGNTTNRYASTRLKASVREPLGPPPSI